MKNVQEEEEEEEEERKKQKKNTALTWFIHTAKIARNVSPALSLSFGQSLPQDGNHVQE